jgi:hypothetical protein
VSGEALAYALYFGVGTLIAAGRHHDTGPEFDTWKQRLISGSLIFTWGILLLFFVAMLIVGSAACLLEMLWFGGDR